MKTKYNTKSLVVGSHRDKDTGHLSLTVILEIQDNEPFPIGQFAPLIRQHLNDLFSSKRFQKGLTMTKEELIQLWKSQQSKDVTDGK